MSSEEVKIHFDGPLATITLNRPEHRNALSPELILALRDYVDELAQREDVGCVVLRGAGKSFCAGYDLKARQRSRAMLSPGFTAEMITALAALPQPVVAAVHGHCFTGGLEFALAADIILAAESARFADTHAKWGMRAGWGLTQRLPRRIGVSAAKEMMFTGRELSGREALALGLANRCAPDELMEAELQACVAQILERSPAAIRWIKHQVDVGADLSLADALADDVRNRPASPAEVDARLRASGWTP